MFILVFLPNLHSNADGVGQRYIESSDRKPAFVEPQGRHQVTEHNSKTVSYTNPIN